MLPLLAHFSASVFFANVFLSSNVCVEFDFLFTCALSFMSARFSGIFFCTV